jgi:hypothetical protein
MKVGSGAYAVAEIFLLCSANVETGERLGIREDGSTVDSEQWTVDSWQLPPLARERMEKWKFFSFSP